MAYVNTFFDGKSRLKYFHCGSNSIGTLILFQIDVDVRINTFHEKRQERYSIIVMMWQLFLIPFTPIFVCFTSLGTS